MTNFYWYTLKKSFVSTRELLGSTVQVVPEINVAKNCLLWRKQLDVLNEVLCYGSTLALQES